MPGIYYKSEKVSDDTSSGNRISENDNLALPQKKIQSIKKMFSDMYQNPQTILFELTKVIDHLTSTILVTLQAKLQCRLNQQQQLQALKKNDS